MNIIDFILHLETHLASIIATHGVSTYGLLAAVIFAETGLVVLPFLPGDSLLFVAGALTATTLLNPIILFLVLTFAAIVGDNVNYWIGRTIGERLIKAKRPIINKKYLHRAHEFYEKHGPVMVVIARFVPIIRTFAPFVAGVSEMTYSTFLPYSIFGGSLWIGVFVFGGYFFGNLPIVKEHFSLVILAIMVISVIPAGIEFIRARKHQD